MQDSSSDIILENSLQSFFYDELIKLNERASYPLPHESIFYSSLVMDRFGESHQFFDVSDEGVKEKILGIRLLEANQLSGQAKRRKLQEIGDTALFLCGYFSESVSRKIVDIGYYHSIGASAYKKLNHLVPEVYDVQNFYKQFSESFQHMTNLMGIVAQTFQSDFDSQSIFIIKTERKSA